MRLVVKDKPVAELGARREFEGRILRLISKGNRVIASLAHVRAADSVKTQIAPETSGLRVRQFAPIPWDLGCHESYLK